MTTGVIVVTHGDAGAAMIEAVRDKIGALPTVVAIGVAPGEAPASLQHRIDEAVAALHADEVLFLTDLGGATPFNLCCKSCNGHGVVVSGLNLAMLFKLSTVDRASGARRLAEELVKTGTKSIVVSEGDR